MGRYAKQRARDRIAALAGHGHDLVTFWDEARDAFAKAVPHYLTPCWHTFDPASLLVTSHYDHGLIPDVPPEWLALEYSEDDPRKMADVARSQQGQATLHDMTGGDPTRSRWYHELIKLGPDQELLTALRTRSGEAWGMLALYRLPGEPAFDPDERLFLRDVAPYLAEGARRALLLADASEPDVPDAPGLVVLGSGWTVESVTPGVARWLGELPDGDWEGQRRLPSAVLSVAGRALRTAIGDAPGEVAVARVLSRGGRWIVLHGASLVADGSRRVAVIVEPAHPARITPLLMSAYGLTDREQEVTRLVLRGESTTQIAQTLVVSPHTVQQHLKKIFEKTGVRSRRDLVGKVFFTHYEPRFRDNERRAGAGEPLRGSPTARG